MKEMVRANPASLRVSPQHGPTPRSAGCAMFPSPTSGPAQGEGGEGDAVWDGAGRSSHSSKLRGRVRPAARNVRPLRALAGSFVP